MKQVVLGASMLIGAAVGLFWLLAIDASLNGAQWPPDWRSWPAYASCPFIPLVGLSRIANAAVPVLNAAAYGVLMYALLRLTQGRRHPVQ